jgi:transcriptional regulator with XRE-family HTH domain
MTDIRRLLAENIKKYRKLKGWTQEKLAETCSCATGYIAVIETARKFPSSTMLERLARAFGIDTPDLFVNKEISHLPPERQSNVLLYQDLLNEINTLIQSKVKKEMTAQA